MTERAVDEAFDAQNRADDAEALAAASIAFAFMANEDAEIATLEAIEARVCNILKQHQDDCVKTLYTTSRLA